MPQETSTSPIVKETVEKSHDYAVQEEKTAEPDIPPPSSQEMADRKRDELKRQLEEKAHAPTKKKRRF